MVPKQRFTLAVESNSGHHVQVTKDGFIPSEVVLTEGEVSFIVMLKT